MTGAFRCYRIHQDGPGRVRAGFEHIALEALDAGDVVIDNRYASVNYKDALAATGRGPIIRRFPCIGGIDAAGVVLSSADPRFSPGDEVVAHGHALGVSRDGGWCERVSAPAGCVTKLPTGLSLLEAITIGVAGYTAALALDLMESFGLAPSQGKVLVNGATGGVSSIVIDLLAQRGYHVVAVTSKIAEADWLRGIGAAEVLAAQDLKMGDRPLESALWAGAVDSLGGEPLAWLTRTMQRDGVIASIGNAAGVELRTTVMPFILRGVRLVGVNSDNPPETTARLWSRLASDLRPRHVQAIARVHAFDDLPDAIEQVIQGRGRGRAVIRLPGA